MRFVFIGSGSLAVLTGRMLVERGKDAARAAAEMRELGIEVDQFAFPYGRDSASGRAWLRSKGYRAAMLTGPVRLVQANSDPIHLRRLEVMPGRTAGRYLLSAYYGAGLVGMHRIGEEGHGFRYQMNQFQEERLAVALSALRQLPNLVLAAPRDEQQLRHLLHTAFTQDHPFALQYPRDAGFGLPAEEPTPIEVGRGEERRGGEEDAAAIAQLPPPGGVAFVVGDAQLEVGHRSSSLGTEQSSAA